MARKAGFPDHYKVPTFTQPDAGEAEPAAVGDYLDETTRPPRLSSMDPEPSLEEGGAVQTGMRRSGGAFVGPEVEEGRAVMQTQSPAGAMAPTRRLVAGAAVSRQTSDGVPVPLPAKRLRPAPARAQRSSRSRMQFNMDVEVEDALDDISAYFRSYAPHEVSASEVLSGLVLALKDALSHVEAQELPERGQWGSDGARQFPHLLKAEFLRAISRYRGRGE